MKWPALGRLLAGAAAAVTLAAIAAQSPAVRGQASTLTPAHECATFNSSAPASITNNCTRDLFMYGNVAGQSSGLRKELEVNRAFGAFGNAGSFCVAYANSAGNGQDESLQNQSGFDPCNTRLNTYDNTANPIKLIIPAKIVKLTLSTTTLKILENSSDAKTFKVKLDRDPNVTVEDDDDDDSEDETRHLHIRSTNPGLSIDPPAINFMGGDSTITNWNNDVTVTVTAPSDNSLDDETATINLTGTGIVSRSISVSLFERIEVERSTNHIEITEGTTETFTYVLKSQPPGDKTIQVSTSHADLKVSAGGSAPARNLTLTFTRQNWNRAQTVTLSMAQDSGINDITGQKVSFVLDDGLVPVSGQTSDEITLLMLDDDIYVEVQVSGGVDVTEGGRRTFVVRLKQRPNRHHNRTVKLTWDNTDLTFSPAALTFSHGNAWTNQQVTITASQDADTVTESATLTLSGAGLTGRTQDFRLVDNDNVALDVSETSLTIAEGMTQTFDVELETDPGQNMTVNLTSNNPDLSFSPSATLNFTGGSAGNWDDAQTVTVTGGQDNDTASDNATINLRGKRIRSNSLTVKVIDDDDAAVTLSPTSVNIDEGDDTTFTVKLASEPGEDRTVTLASNDPDIRLDTDPDTLNDQHTLEFTTRNWNNAQTVRMVITQDNDTASESASVSFSGTKITTGSLPVTVNDDDDVELDVSKSSLSIGEGSTDTFTVKLKTDPGESMSVSLESDNADVTLSAASLSFTGGSGGNWNDAQTVTVTAGHDDDFDNDSATIDLTGARITASSATVSVTDDDIGLTLSATTLTVVEEKSATFTIELASAPTGNATVTLVQPDDNTNDDVTISPASLTFTTGDWDDPQTVTVSAGDDQDGFDETASISISSSGGGYDGLTESVSVSITDNDDQKLILSPASLSIGEGENKTFSVKLSALPSGDVEVTLMQPTNTDVTVDTDAGTTDNQTTLTFTTGNWNDAQTVTVTAADDADVIDDRASIALFAEDGGYDDIVGSLGVTVIDDEDSILTLSGAPLSVTEGGTGRFSVKLASDPGAVRTVALKSSSSDVTLSAPSLSFSGGSDGDWNVAQSVTVTAGSDDDTDDDSATISLSGDRIESASVAVTVTDDDVGLTLSKTSLIIDEDGSDIFTVQLAKQPQAAITVTLEQPTNTDVTVDKTSLQFTTGDWNTAQTVRVSAVHDDDHHNDTAAVKLTGDQITDASVTVTVVDDEVGLELSGASLAIDEGSNATFTVRLKTQPSAAVRVTLKQPDDGTNADVNISPATLDFSTTNWGMTQIVTVSAAQDSDSDDDSARIDLSASGAEYEGKTGSLSVRVTDDDDAGLILSASSLKIDEGENDALTVQLAALPSGDVEVTLTQPGNTDVTLDKTSLDFTTLNWDSPQTVAVRTAQDSDSLDDNTSISLSASGGGYDGITVSVAVSVTDDDDIDLTLSPTSLTLSEGATGSFTVRLDSDPGGIRSVSLESDNDDVTLSAASLSFTGGAGGDWNVAQSVTVTAGPDNDINDDSATISLTGDGLTDGSVEVTVTDDDAELTVSPTSLTIDEGGSDSFTVELTRQPAATITVTVEPPANTDVTVDQTSLEFTASNWNSPKTVTVNAAHDADSDSDTATINLTGSQVADVSVTVTVTEDDIGLDLSATKLTLDESGSGTFTVVLKTQPSTAVTVRLKQPEDIANSDVSFSPALMVFSTTDWRATRTITVNAARDSDTVDDSATIRLSAAGGNYGGISESVAITVTDNDKPGLALSGTPLTIDEEQDGEFKVRLVTQPGEDVMVTLMQPTNTDVTLDTDANAPDKQNTLTFTADNWNDPQTVTVSAAADDDSANDTATISLSASGDAYDDITASVAVSVTDGDDVTLSLSSAALTVTEGGSSTFTVALASDPGEDMIRTVSLKSSSGEVVLSAATLTFTGGSAGNWGDDHTVRVSAVSDRDTDDDGATIRLTGNRIAETSVAVTVTDDDVNLTLSASSLALGEGDEGSLTVRLTRQPPATVTVTLMQPANTDVTVDKTSLEFTTSNWSAPQTVMVRAGQDDDLVDDRAVLRLTGAQIIAASVVVKVTDDDVGLELSTASLAVDEADSGTFTVKLRTPPSAPVTVVLVQNPDETPNDDVTPSPASLNFTTEDWGNPRTVTVNAAEDDNAVDESVTISLTASGGNYENVKGSLSVSVRDNDDAELTISETRLDVTEGGSGATFTVQLATEPSEAVRVKLTQSGTANADVKFSPASLDFTASNWRDPQTVTVNAVGDKDAADESAAISLAASGGEYDDVTGTVSVSVTDIDTAGLTISETRLTVNEGGSNTFTVRLATEPTADATVKLTQSGTANADVTISPASLIFTAGDWEDPQTVTVRAAHDDDFDDDSAGISLSASGGGYGDITGSVSVRVAEDDLGLSLSPVSLDVTEESSGIVRVALRTQPSANVTVRLSQSGTTTNPDVNFSPDSLDFTTDDWDTPQAVTVSAADDDDAIADSASIALNASGGDYQGVTRSLPVSVKDNDTPGLTLSEASVGVTEGGSATFTVHLATRPSGDVTVMPEQPSDAANSAVDFSPAELNFTADNWKDPRTVTVTAGQDDDSENGSARIDLKASGGDYGDVKKSVTVTVTDDDQPKLTLSGTPLTIEEGGSAPFTVALATQPSGDVEVTLMQPSNTDVTVDTDARTGGNQTVLTFTVDNWNDAQSVTVSAGQDADLDDDSASIALSASGGGYGDVTESVSVAVTDNDLPKLILTPKTLNVAEGSSGSFTARLSAAPSSEVSIAVTSDRNDVTPSPASLTFTTSNWGADQTVNVETIQDPDRTQHTATISLAGAGIATGSVSVTVADDGNVGLALSTDTLPVEEGREATFTVRLHAQPSSDAAIALAADGDAVTLSPTSLTFTSANYSTAQTVTVTAAEDSDFINDSALISLTGAGITRGALPVTIIDNDEGAMPEEEEAGAALQLAAIAANLAPATSSTISLRFDAPRGARAATVAGRQIALDRSLIRDL
ncbi:MAG: hypothetical protein ISN29_09070, partial [Gammaproteobacteria bacterium AqS3]|nr:hypothetical protein [Gammaproteobacteria bacterium AqS3]